MDRYISILKNRSAQYLLVAAFPARMAYGMISLAIYFKVQQTSGSIALAGLAAGVNGVAGATTAGLRGTVVDRIGMQIPLRVLAPTYAALIVFFSTAQTNFQLVLFAGILGFTAPPINLSVRPLWKITVPPEQIRVAYSLDTSIMNSVGVFGPLASTSISLAHGADSALRICASLMVIGGLALSFSSRTKSWRPEKKTKGDLPVWKVPAMRLLMLEGMFIGLGWGLFDIGVPAFTTIEKIPERTGVIFAIMATGNVIGGLFAGMISKHTSSLRAFRRNYTMLFIFSLPLVFTYPNWTMMTVTFLMSLMAGGLQVFYLEISEAVRPKGTAVAALGWLWTVEGTFSAIGSALGGFISEHFSPRYCLASTTICVGIGLLIMTLGQNLLKAADRIPDSKSDEAALEANVDTNK